MPAPLHACDVHGVHEGESCPVCGESGDRVLSGERRRRLSKFVSGALRHFPGDAGIDLDAAGWTTVDELAGAVERKYDWAGRRELTAVLATDPKGRFERTGGEEATGGDGATAGPDRVRAAYGHSVDVDLDLDANAGSPGGSDGSESAGAASGATGAQAIPDELYHGTAPRNLAAIREEGLKPMGRQAVHLSGTVADAREVGARHADEPVVLAVDAAGMLADGREIAKRGRATYTTDRVPPAYLTVRD